MASRRGHAWSRFVTITTPFFRSEARWRAVGLLALLVGLLVSVSGLNVLNSFVGRDFMTAIEERHADRFSALALVYAGVFVASTVVAVLCRFVEEHLGLRWREWLTRHLLRRYLSGHAYYRLNSRADIDNPDQRIAEDVKTFTVTALSFLLIAINSTVTLLSFSGILWSITPWLFLAAAGYAAFGSLTTVLLGRRLVGLDVQQLRREADLRYDLIQVRTRAEAVALLRGERAEEGRLGRRLQAVVDNMKSIIALNRNIGFFTVGFDYMIQLIPVLIVAPLYMSGRAQFGTVTQAAMAFAHVMGAFSLIVKEFQRISAFGAVIERLGAAWEAVEEEGRRPSKSALEVAEDTSRLAYERLTLLTPRDGRLLVKDLSVQLPHGQRLLVTGPKGSGRTALLRATAGLWTSAAGRITRPPLGEVMFLPQQPYLPPGTLRDQLLYATHADDITDEQIRDVLRRVKFEAVLERVGGLDAECDWHATLSLGEQQTLAVARLLLANPRFAFLDEATSGLDPARGQALYDVLSRSAISYVSVAADPGLRKYHDKLLELYPSGVWEVTPREQAVSA